ncbi:phage shock protein [Kiloniella litopenaei]|uniref:Phage shock protein n=1 Tax=Kiloniella litopenaei TaxID=1549748 RepID=A0A0M2R1U3_9PROT|nr:phage shock protein PspA [Kiloniella litopenaei]KKJ75616.1 phage shock protein [Kiloniella litopenaei]
MSIFSRLTDIVNSNINSLLDRAEEPEKMARLMIQEMEDTLIEVRSSSVKAIADKKDIEKKLAALETSKAEWASKAEFALSKGRDDLAKGALLAKRKIEEQADALQAELGYIEESLAKSNDDLSKLQAKLDEAKAKKKSMEIRLNTAEKRVKLRKTTYDGRVDDALARYDNLERKITELDAEADSYDLGRTKTLNDEFSELEAESEIADELAALKAKMSKSKK